MAKATAIGNVKNALHGTYHALGPAPVALLGRVQIPDDPGHGFPLSRPKQTILNDVGWSTPHSKKNQPGKYTYTMPFTGYIGQVIVANCGS